MMIEKKFSALCDRTTNETNLFQNSFALNNASVLLDANFTQLRAFEQFYWPNISFRISQSAQTL